MGLLKIPNGHKPSYDNLDLDGILDETLREGTERCPYSVTPCDKVTLISKILDTGVRDIVYGSGPKDPTHLANTIKELLEKDILPQEAKFSFIMLLNCHDPIMAQLRDFPEELKKYVTISFGMISYKADKEIFEKTVDALRSWGFDSFRVSLLNNFSAGIDEESYEIITNDIDRSLAAGISTVRINDSLGTLYPEAMAILAANLRNQYTSADFCLHAHNDRGLGLQNALVSLYNGFNLIEGGFAGTGNRSGLPAIEILDLIFKERNITINGEQLDSPKVLEAARLTEETFMSLPDLYRPVSGLIVEQENMGVTNIPAFLGESRDIPFFLNSTGLHDATIKKALLDTKLHSVSNKPEAIKQIKDKLEDSFYTEYQRKREDFNQLKESVMKFYSSDVLYSSCVGERIQEVYS